MRGRLTSTHFVGRIGELAELELAFREAAARRPVLVLLSGESGVGKTRLVAEFEQRIVGGVEAALVLRGEAVEQSDGELPYAPLLGALRPLVRESDPVLETLGRSARTRSPGSLNAPAWSSTRTPARPYRPRTELPRSRETILSGSPRANARCWR